MTQSFTNVSTLGTHTRGLVTADWPLLLSNLLPNSALSVSCDESTAAFVEVSLSHSSLEPLFVPAAIGNDGVVEAGASAIEEIRCKVAAIATRLSAEVSRLRAVTAEQAATHRGAPAGITAVACFGGEQVTENIGDEAFEAAQTYDVVVMCRGASTSGKDDGAAIFSAIRALHFFQRLRYVSCESDFEDNARYYTLTFKVTQVRVLAT